MSLPALRDGATLAAAVQELHRVAESISKVGNANTRDILGDYITWATTSESLLRNVFEIDVAQALVYTPRYWALIGTPPADSVGYGMVRNELAGRGEAFARLIEELASAEARWQSGPVTLVVPDTNMFLQEGAPIQGIDWPREVRSRVDVRVVIPLVTIHELDRLKRTGNNTTRLMARESIRWLTSELPPVLHGRSARFERDFPSATIEAWVDDTPSAPPDADLAIIEATRQLGRLSGMSTLLVTRDLNMRLRAQLFGVEALQLPDLDEPPSRRSLRRQANRQSEPSAP